MARAYRLTPCVRMRNAVAAALVRRGVRLGGNARFTVPGRTGGQPRTSPVTILEGNGERFPRSPFGEVNWVRVPAGRRRWGAATGQRRPRSAKFPQPRRRRCSSRRSPPSWR